MLQTVSFLIVWLKAKQIMLSVMLLRNVERIVLTLR
jgi:hypothetical protein